MNEATKLEAGKRYRLTYRLPQQRLLRRMVATYLGRDRFGEEREFDLRPLFGTTSLRDEWIRGVVEVPADHAPEVDTVVREVLS